jgi:hypothetical protein
MTETCKIKYVQTLNHTKQQKITNTTVAKKETKKQEKNEKEIHQLPTSCMYLNLILLGSPKI